MAEAGEESPDDTLHKRLTTSSCKTGMRVFMPKLTSPGQFFETRPFLKGPAGLPQGMKFQGVQGMMELVTPQLHKPTPRSKKISRLHH